MSQNSTFNLKNLEEKYDLELDRIIKEIKSKKPKSVLLQLPDGLKPYSTSIIDYLEEQFKGKIQFKTWLGSCFGACDTPQTKSDLIIQFGHAKWK